MSTSAERGTRIGRATGYLLLGLIVSGFTAVCTVEIIQQVWFPEVKKPELNCRAGLKGLVLALDRARNVGAGAPAEGGASAALAAFRQALEPEWGAREAVALACKPDPRTAKALKQIEQLRYAEEHAVRYEAHNLSRLRHQVSRLLTELGLSATSQASDLPRVQHHHE